MMKVADLKNGQRVEIPLLVKEKSLVEHKNRAGRYMHLVLTDNEDDIDAFVWDNAEEMSLCCAPGRVSIFSGDVITYRENLQLKVLTVRYPEEGEVDLTAYLPVCKRPLKEMEDELINLVESMKPGIWKEIAETFVVSDLFTEFCRGTAAKTFHHNYWGGLLEHTLGVMKVVDRLSSVYPEADRELMLLGALLHDVGKVREMQFTPGIVYTDEGRLLGHIVIGLQIVDRMLDSIEGISNEERYMVLHMIASHHGEYEWQSPKRPQFLEAKLVHLADMIDAEVFKYVQAEPEEPGGKWSFPVKGIPEPVFLGGRGNRGNSYSVKEHDALAKDEGEGV